MTESTPNSPQVDLAKLRRSHHAMISWQNAQQHLHNRRYGPAVAGFRSLTQQFPAVSQLWAELGNAAEGELDFALANQATRRAAELAANDAPMLVAIGTQFYRLRNFEQASACFERAVVADPSSINARLTLSSWLERSRRLDEAWSCLESLLAQHSKEGRALYARAFLLHCKKLNGEAETALRDLLKNESSLPLETQVNAYHLLGVVLDALGQYAEALSCFGKSKTLRRKTANIPALEQGYDKMSRDRRELLAGLTPDMVRRWREEAAAAPCPYPMAFLGGAPRSGTTLIEQIFGAHPDILIFDELDSFMMEIMRPLRTQPPAPALTAKALDELPAATCAQMVERYFKIFLREMEQPPQGKLLLDKNPAITPFLHIWLRFFPQSKVIIALRDPRDVVISSYFQTLKLTIASVNFFSLERTVKYYSDCMDVWLRMRDLGGFDWIETRYEDVVSNLEGEGRRITNFVGLPWHEGQATYYEMASRKFLDAPTYNDVTKPVHNRAVGRWEHYAEALAPLQAGLEPYLRTFGYAR
jgi:tetratricopeptide (TPR) repeat protein